MTYLIKPPRTPGLKMLHTAEELNVRIPDTYRTKKVHRSPIGNIREIEADGKDEQRLEVRGKDPLSPAGTAYYPSRATIYVDRRQVAVEKHVRRLRVADAELVEEVDADIESAREQLRLLRAKRGELVRAAWPRAERVPLRELADRILAG